MYSRNPAWNRLKASSWIFEVPYLSGQDFEGNFSRESEWLDCRNTRNQQNRMVELAHRIEESELVNRKKLAQAHKSADLKDKDEYLVCSSMQS